MIPNFTLRTIMVKDPPSTILSLLVPRPVMTQMSESSRCQTSPYLATFGQKEASRSMQPLLHQELHVLHQVLHLSNQEEEEQEDEEKKKRGYATLDDSHHVM